MTKDHEDNTSQSYFEYTEMCQCTGTKHTDTFTHVRRHIGTQADRPTGTDIDTQAHMHTGIDSQAHMHTGI